MASRRQLKAKSLDLTTAYLYRKSSSSENITKTFVQSNVKVICDIVAIILLLLAYSSFTAVFSI